MNICCNLIFSFLKFAWMEHWHNFSHSARAKEACNSEQAHQRWLLMHVPAVVGHCHCDPRGHCLASRQVPVKKRKKLPVTPQLSPEMALLCYPQPSLEISRVCYSIEMCRLWKIYIWWFQSLLSFVQFVSATLCNMYITSNEVQAWSSICVWDPMWRFSVCNEKCGFIPCGYKRCLPVSILTPTSYRNKLPDRCILL